MPSQSVQVVAAWQGSAGHMVRVQSQAAQLPMVGPLIVPLAQALDEPHQPQSARPVQSSQLTPAAQGSAPQLEESQSQVAHVPLAGPTDVPELQVFVAAHQPQPMRAAQSPHIVELLQGSTGSMPQDDGA
jgi:hypothetical protein